MSSSLFCAARTLRYRVMSPLEWMRGSIGTTSLLGILRMASAGALQLPPTLRPGRFFLVGSLVK